MSSRSVVRAAFFMSPSPTKEETSDCANGSPAFPFRSGSKEVHVMTKWPLPSRIVWIEHRPLAVDHLAVLCHRHVDAGAALSIDQFDRLGHWVGIFAAVLRCLRSAGRCRPYA